MVYSGQEELAWMRDADCTQLPLDLFFERYENDPKIAAEVDEVCFGCPVMKDCRDFGVRTNATGCFGGVYLLLGKFNRAKNAHKSPAIQEAFIEAIKAG